MNSISGTPELSTTEKKDDEKVNWLAEVRGLLWMLLAVLAFHSLVAKPFYIPSTSMMPTVWGSPPGVPGSQIAPSSIW